MQSPATWALHFLLQYSTLPRLWLLSWLSTSIGLTRIHKVCSTLLHPQRCIYLYTLCSATISITPQLEHKQSIFAPQTTLLRSITNNGFLHQQAQQEILQTLQISHRKDVRLSRRIHTLREGTIDLQAPTHRERECVPWWCSVQVRFPKNPSLAYPFLPFLAYTSASSRHMLFYLFPNTTLLPTEHDIDFTTVKKSTPKSPCPPASTASKKAHLSCTHTPTTRWRSSSKVHSTSQTRRETACMRLLV